ncbi:MAG: PfkB family carbohydrate kinase [Candidatus Hydrogenedentes bacterium]|nr:PfkB family carbohydrate kinase [Candidatus Hydrogenedentota bacterium]
MGVTVVGSVGLDSVETPYGKAELELGGAAVYFSLSASFFTDVNLIGVVGEDFPEIFINILQSREINLEGLQRLPGRTFRWRGRYHKDMNNRDTLDTQLNVFENFKPIISATASLEPYLFLANIHPALQLDVLKHTYPNFIGMDTMNLWINTTPDLLQEVLSRVNMLFINDSEAKELSGENNIKKASLSILASGPEALIVKKGEHGCILFLDDGDHFALPAFLLEDVIDPTGAGDSFAGGVMGYVAYRDRYDVQTLKEALVVGTVMASFACESFGPNKLINISMADIRDRCEKFIQQTQLESYPLLPENDK